MRTTEFKAEIVDLQFANICEREVSYLPESKSHRRKLLKSLKSKDHRVHDRVK